ncbi:MAG TPA: Rieske (2Fe-2S) protein [Vicinamibacterales bacterium]|nr:Rieske (2Fe-2S) protein [Vicinamibacterales bacterium]
MAAAQLPRAPESWYHACRSSALAPGTILTWRLFDRPLVVYRGASGRVVAMDARCPHMGAHLGHGRVNGDRLTCALHHWTCDAAGRCSAPDGGGRLRGRVYPVVERYGSVFVFPARTARFELPQIDPDDDRELRVVAGPPRFIHTSWASIATNAFDADHMDAVHKRAMREAPVLSLVGGDCLQMRYVSRVTGNGVSDRIMRWVSNDAVHATIRCWGGTLIGVRSEAGAIVSRLLLCLTPQPHGVEITPLFARPVSGNAAVDRILLDAGRWLFTAFLTRDLVPLDDMDLRIEGALSSRGAVGFAARWLLTIPAAPAIADQPDDLALRVVQRVTEPAAHAGSQV